mgnify:CR=1 FL=1
MFRIKTILPNWFSSCRAGEAADLIHSVDRMRAILDRERMRSDRGRSSFALVAFTFARNAPSARLAVLARILVKRIRATDDAGLLGPHRVGVILPETSAEGAWKLAEDVCALLPPDVQHPTYDVYMHPSDGEPGESEAREAQPQEVPGHGGNDTDEVAEPAAARPMQALFVRPIPFWKRAIDVVGAATALVLAAPLMLCTAVAIKLTSSGPVFFTQKRDTLGGQQFTMYKFRTMAVNAEQQKAALRALSEQDGPAFKITNDPRVTRLGRFLRKTSIDELPQLFNVLAGDMSLVGPRPLPCDESRNCEPWQRRRLDVTPGLTCIWQIRGRSAVSFCEWIRMDLEYIRSRSLKNDVKLIAQTVPAVALRRGAC